MASRVPGLAAVASVVTTASDWDDATTSRFPSDVAKRRPGTSSNTRKPDRPPPTLLSSSSATRSGEPTENVQTNQASAPTPAAVESPAEEPRPRLSGTSIALIMAPLCLSVTLSSLDLTIITPALPAIVGTFHSVAGYIWIGGAFILASTAITPVWGSVADIWGRKPIILIALSLFLGGSLLCALAPQMDAIIAGRAVQGLGASGMSTMVNVIICDSFSLRDRGLYLAITSIVWAVGSAVGPVLGGLFTTRLDWRWCFWINLPVGAVVFIVLLFYLKVPSPHTPVMAGLKAIDWPGSLLVVGGALMILLGLDFGNVTYPWSSATVICLIVFGAAAVGLFAIHEWKLAPNPIVPLRLFSTLSSAACYAVFALNFYVFIGLSYYLPLYSQAVLGANALSSGVYLLPLIVSCSLAAACTGAFIQQTGIYLPVMYIAQGISMLGVGLFVYLGFEQNLTKLLIFEAVAGIGAGMNIEPPMLAAQAVASVEDTASVVAMMGFIRSILTAISVVVGGVIFQNQMDGANSALAEVLGPQLASQFVGNLAPANIEAISSLPPHQQDTVRQTYFEALRAVWIMYVVFAGLSTTVTPFIRAHHLSTETQDAVLGVDRAKRSAVKTQRANQSLPVPDPIGLQ